MGGGKGDGGSTWDEREGDGESENERGLGEEEGKG